MKRKIIRCRLAENERTLETNRYADIKGDSHYAGK